MKAAALLLVIIFGVACGSIGRATGTLSELKASGEQDMYGHAFTITAKPLPNGAVRFHVVISRAADKFDPHFDHASLEGV
ncbi:MAG TPA: hypothetical protein VGM54_01210 [Chthoniobacter sp.]